MYGNVLRTISYVFWVLLAHFGQYTVSELFCKLTLISLWQGKSKQSRRSANSDVHIPQGLANNEGWAFSVCMCYFTQPNCNRYFWRNLDTH
jgi:hypothetical protein